MTATSRLAFAAAITVLSGTGAQAAEQKKPAVAPEPILRPVDERFLNFIDTKNPAVSYTLAQVLGCGDTGMAARIGIVVDEGAFRAKNYSGQQQKRHIEYARYRSQEALRHMASDLRMVFIAALPDDSGGRALLGEAYNVRLTVLGESITKNTGISTQLVASARDIIPIQHCAEVFSIKAPKISWPFLKALDARYRAVPQQQPSRPRDFQVRYAPGGS